MKTNITIDNYEAYLLDYMEGNLSPEMTAELKAFVAAQGLDWDELTEELPHLEAPQIVYEGKEKLKNPEPVEGSKGRSSDNKRTIVPLYVKIASAAAAAGLLLTVTLWPEKSMPKVEPIANLKPIEISRIDTHEPIALLPRRAIESIDPMPHTSLRWEDLLSEVQNNGRIAAEREAMPLLAELPTKNITSLQTDLPLTNTDEPDFGFLAWRMNANLAYTEYEASTFSAETEDERELSLIGKAIFKLTDGRHDSFASLISSGLTTAKKEISLAATDMALAAYHRADEHFEEAKEHWEEKLGE
jgi:hypothetical protein